MADPYPIHVRRKEARAWLEAHCPAEIDSPAADAVCQGRQHWPKYSGCADLAHALLEALGSTSSQLNRAPHWVDQVNVSRLRLWPGAIKRPGYAPLRAADLAGIDAGDVLIRWAKPDTTDAHVVCVVAAHGDGTISTAEYGQAPPTIGRLFTRQIVGEGRPFRVWLPLPIALAPPAALAPHS